MSDFDVVKLPPIQTLPGSGARCVAAVLASRSGACGVRPVRIGSGAYTRPSRRRPSIATAAATCSRWPTPAAAAASGWPRDPSKSSISPTTRRRRSASVRRYRTTSSTSLYPVAARLSHRAVERRARDRGADASCQLYETYDTSFAADVLSAYSGAVWNLRASLRAVATRHSVGDGVRAVALRRDGSLGGSRERLDQSRAELGGAGGIRFRSGTFVRPASDAEGIAFKGSGGVSLPYGARLRLRASISISSRFGPQSAAIARAMKTLRHLSRGHGARERALRRARAGRLESLERARSLRALGDSHHRFRRAGAAARERVPGH